MMLNLDRLLVSARITAQRWAHMNNWAWSLRISKYVDAKDTQKISTKEQRHENDRLNTANQPSIQNLFTHL